MSDKRPMFPVLNDDTLKAIPWDVLKPHEAQAKANHGQSLNALASRGGLSIEEAYCVLKDMRWPTGTKWRKSAVRIALMRMVHDADATRQSEDGR